MSRQAAGSRTNRRIVGKAKRLTERPQNGYTPVEMKNDWLIRLQDKKYGGQYVASWRDKAIASARTYGALERKLDRLKLGKS